MATDIPVTAPATARSAAEPLSKRRRIAIWALIVVATIIGIASILTTWVNRQVLDNDSWKTSSAELIADPEIQQTLSVYLVDQLYANVDVAAQLEDRLPNNLKGLAAPLAGALREPTTRTVQRLLAAPRVQQLWVTANAEAHRKLINVLENKTGSGIDTGDGTVTLDLRELLAELGVNLGIPPAALERLPQNAGVVTVMTSDQLGMAQTAVRLIRFLSVWLLVLVLVLYALAIFLARGRRRETLRNVGFAFILLGLLTLVVRHVTGDYVIGTLTTPNSERAGDSVWVISTSILEDIGWAMILYGFVAVLGTLLAGPTSYAVATRRRMAPVMNDRPGIVWGVAGAVFLLLVLWGGTHALRTAWGILLLGVLLAAGVAALRRESLLEFPRAESPPP